MRSHSWGVFNVLLMWWILYIEKINPKNPNQYEVNGKWVDMKLVQETIQVGEVSRLCKRCAIPAMADFLMFHPI